MSFGRFGLLLLCLTAMIGMAWGVRYEYRRRHHSNALLAAGIGWFCMLGITYGLSTTVLKSWYGWMLNSPVIVGAAFLVAGGLLKAQRRWFPTMQDAVKDRW